jgi:hypothetical protein
MKSFSLLRTNVGLTSNVKVICDSKYNLYLESIDSVPELNINKLKKFQFSKNNFYDELVPYLFKDFPSDVAFEIAYANDNKNMSTDFANQYDDLYQMGARNIVDNKNYQEEFEYFAPLYVFKNSFPKNFIIFRIDGPGLLELNSDNFREEYLKNFKTVKLFDLTKNTTLGEWIERNFTKNPVYPTNCLEIDFRNLEFSKWIGIDYLSGGYTYKSSFLENSLEVENTIFDFEKFIFDGFKTNKIIFPQIINFSFLFDDTPATSTSLRKWSLNRYSGFFLEDLELVDTITPFITQQLKSGFQILDGNVLYHPSGDPFVLGFKDSEDMWIEYGGNFYKVSKFTETRTKVLANTISKNPEKRILKEKINKTEINKVNSYGETKGLKQETIKKEEYQSVTDTKYRIISDLDLEGKENLVNTKSCYINSDNQILYTISGLTYSIDNFDSSDVNLIEIDGSFHNLLYENGYMTVFTDYGFSYKDSYRFEYFINSPDPNYYKFIDLVITNNNPPTNFKIYKAKFSDIKDFDTSIIDTEFSKFEYEKLDELTDTEELKMYTTDLRINSNPPNYNDYIYKNEVTQVPCSSDYTANLETFRIVDEDLNQLWRKNPIHCRFAFQGSISANDYPYLLNNNDVHEDFNKTTDTFEVVPNRRKRNLDYFYTINSGTISYLHHSLHIEKNYDIQDASFRFELDKYLNLYTYSQSGQSVTYSCDYFEYFFGSTQSFLSGEIVKSVDKFSYFDYGDNAIPNTTLFRGLKFRIFEVDSITKDDVSIENLNLKTSNKFDNYKLSVFLSQNLKGVDDDNTLYDTSHWGYFIDNQFNPGSPGSSTLAFKTSDTATPSNIQIGDVIEVKQFYPYDNSGYNGLFRVTQVGGLDYGGYGFITDKPFTTSTSVNPGYYKVNFQWKLIREWEQDIQYYIGDLVIYDNVLYLVTVNNIISDPNDDPSTLNSYYSLTTFKIPFWNPNVSYGTGEWCYRDGEYYVRNSNPESSGIDFWHTTKTYTSAGEIVKLKGKFYQSVENDITKIKPTSNSKKNDISNDSKKYWKEIPDPRTWYAYPEDFSNDFTDDLWDPINIWNDEDLYYADDYVVNNNTLYKCLQDTTSNETPNNSDYWSRIYNFELETDFEYTGNSNPIIQIGESYYLCTFGRDLTLDSGITIYINKKWKNVLVNININDNTCFNIDNSERDELYNDTNSRLTAANFIRQFNDLDSKYDFADYTTYVIIEEDGTFKKYNFENKIENLPFLILCEEPDQFELKNNSLIYKPSTISRTRLKPLRYLVNGEIDDLQKLNYYNEIPLGCEIDKNVNEAPVGNILNGRSNITISKNATIKPKSNANVTETFYRHSGNYMPLFYKVDLFRKRGEFDTVSGNYKFDESLTFFGLMKQRVISKINRKENVLKLREQEEAYSIYPMLDEFGYTVIDFFIFKSTWDYDYHIECKQQPVISAFNIKPQRLYTLNKFTSKDKIKNK